MKLSNSILGNRIELIDDEIRINNKVVYEDDDADIKFWDIYYSLIQLCSKACDEVIRQWLNAQ